MKKLIFIVSCLFLGTNANAQDITDAVRYGNTSIQGSARFKALSGAFGALGGDLSAINVNPAGSAVFNSSFASVTLGIDSKKTNTNYFGTSNSKKTSDFNLSQAGAVFLFKNTKQDSKFKKFTLAVAYDQLNSFENKWNASGINRNNSISNYFLDYAQGLRLDQISAFTGESTSDAYTAIGNSYGTDHQQAFLGYDSFILEPNTFDDENTGYTSNITGGNYSQKYEYTSTGYNGKMAFNIATQYTDDIYFGLNLNSHFINFERKTFFYEGNNNATSIVKEVAFENALETNGTGFSFQLGTIFKLTKNLRGGLSYESPTWLNIEEETTQYLETSRDDAGILSLQVTDPNIVNVFPEYRLQTPGKITSSLAYIFGKSGLISLDYSIKDYSATKFKPKNDTYFESQNRIIEDNLVMASNLNIGGEYKYKAASFRAGYRFEQSPYKDTNIVGNLNGYSLGLGYTFGNTKLDVAYAASQQKSNTNLYNVGLTDTASIENRNSNITVTLGFTL